jgi:hypothetical protein
MAVHHRNTADPTLKNHPSRLLASICTLGSQPSTAKIPFNSNVLVYHIVRH